MFRKPFSIKSSTNVRHSERKTLFSESINACFNSKQQFSRIQITLQNGISPLLFVCDKDPLFFQRPRDSTIFPTVYFLWNHPFHQQFPILFVYSTVLQSLQRGSDLMIPGVLSEYHFSDFNPGAPIAIATVVSDTDGSSEGMIYSGPVAIGCALLSSMELRNKIKEGQKGKAVEVLHTYGDFLWEFGSRKAIPKLSSGFNEDDPQKFLRREQLPIQLHEEYKRWKEGSSSVVRESDNENEERQENHQAAIDADSGEQQRQDKSQAQMEEMLCNAFFSSLRWNLVDSTHLPIDAGQFYANYILKNLPRGERLEIKKTRYKKFATFLRDINSDEWVVRLKTVKGIDSIEAVNFEHPLVQKAPQPQLEDCVGKMSTVEEGPRIQIRQGMYSLTEQVMPLFRPAGLRKGDLVDLDKIRTIVLEYAQKQNLIRDYGKAIELDDMLQMIVQYFLPEKLAINKLVQKLGTVMTSAVLIQTQEGRQIVHRSKMPSIDLKIEKRSGNKLVTLVSNLASFGIDAKNLDKKIRGTGTSILTSAPACEGPQLMIQGNEINRIVRILSEFGVPKNFVKGQDLGLKDQKKKKN